MVPQNFLKPPFYMGKITMKKKMFCLVATLLFAFVAVNVVHADEDDVYLDVVVNTDDTGNTGNDGTGTWALDSKIALLEAGMVAIIDRLDLLEEKLSKGNAGSNLPPQAKCPVHCHCGHCAYYPGYYGYYPGYYGYYPGYYYYYPRPRWIRVYP